MVVAPSPALPAEIDSRFRRLATGGARWRKASAAERGAVARRCLEQLSTMDLDWVPDTLRTLGIEPSKRDAYNTLGFDPFLFVTTLADRFTKVAESFEGTLTAPQPEKLSNGSLKYDFGPLSANIPGMNLELWADASGSEEAGRRPPAANTPSQHTFTPAAEAGLCLVLGAGNQNFLTAGDVIERAFMHGECVFVKHHPIRACIGAIFSHIFAPLEAAGGYDQCLDADVKGAYTELVCHPEVRQVHMTGSGATHDRIVASLREAGRDQDVGITSELGCVTPWIVCPGTRNAGAWSKKELTHHARLLTGAFKSSCSMNCLSPKVLVLPTEEAWPQRREFLQALKKELAERAQPAPYYPGAHERYAAFKREYGDAEEIRAPPAQQETIAPLHRGQSFAPLHSLLVEVGELGAPDARPYAVQNEAFAPVLAVATVRGSARDFPEAAAEAVNQHVFGTLSCTLVYPDAPGADLDAVIQTLNYGCVAVNMWSAFGYGNALGVWGGAPGSYTRDAPQSGLEFVGNVAGVQGVVKSVVRSAFVNKALASTKALPLLLLDVLYVVASGQPSKRAGGILLKRGFGLLPRKMPPAASKGDTPSKGEASRARRCCLGA